MKKKMDYFCHPTAEIDEGAEIGKNSKIWHYSHIMPGAQIGEGCSLGQNVVVHSTARIGNNVKIQNNVSVYDGVVLEDGVFCGPSCVFTNIINPRAEIPRNSQDFYKNTLVKTGATIGANATIICGITIGAYAFVGAGAVVTKDVKDFELVYGTPAKHRGWMCSCGEKINLSKGEATCKSCGNRYKERNSKVGLIK